MDVISILNTPAGVALITAVGGIVGAWIGARLNSSGAPGIRMENSSGNAITQDNSVNWTENHYNRTVYQGPVPESGAGLGGPEVVMMGMAGLATTALAVSWLAPRWTVVLIAGPIALAVAAIILTAGVGGYALPRGRLVFAVQCVASLLAFGLALTLFAAPGNGVPSLLEVGLATRELTLRQGVERVIELLGPFGLGIYSLRLMGMGSLAILVLLLCREAVGHLLIIRGRRLGSDAVARRGARWAASTPSDWKVGVLWLLLTALLLAFVHPGSPGLAVEFQRAVAGWVREVLA